MADPPAQAVLFALITAVLFGLNTVIAKKGLQSTDTWDGALISVGLPAVGYGVLAIFFVPAEDWRSPGVWVFLVNGLFQPFMALGLYLEATRRLGPTIAASVSSIAPMLAVLWATLVLGKPLSAPTAAGTLAVVAGMVVLSWRGGAPKGWTRAALLFPLAAAVIRAGAHNAARYGMVMLSSPLTAALLTHLVSTAALVVVWLARRQRRAVRIDWRRIHWRRGNYFALLGLVNSVAVVSMYRAFALGEVVVVSPIVSSFPLFTLCFGVLFRQEAFTLRMLAGVLLIVPGVMLIAMLS